MISASARAGRRLARALAAVTALLLVATSATIGASAATAASAGYVGTGDTTVFDEYGGTRVLPIMTAGEAYSAAIVGPQFGSSTSWCWSVSGSLPAGITMSTPGGECAPSATFSGTPEAGEFEFTLEAQDTAGESTYGLTFSGVVEASTSPTTTTLTAPVIAPVDAIAVSATVAGNPDLGSPPTGTVQFFAVGPDDDDAILLGSATLAAGVATTSLSVDRLSAGAELSVTARYLGDDDYAASTSSPTVVVPYLTRLGGTVSWNGTIVEGATVQLLNAGDPSTVVDTGATNAAGEFELDLPAVETLADLLESYAVRATFPDSEVLYFAEESTNVTGLEDADLVTATTRGLLEIVRETGPRWADDGLAVPRVASAYSDGVTATGRGTITYSITSGTLPAGLALNASTGAVTGTPAACTEAGADCAYDFTVSATNGYGTVSERFIGTVLPAGVAPTWEDEELPDLQEGVAVDDGVLAVGDPTITYAVTDGRLPAGVHLSSSTGSVTGTPSTPGPYEFTITAANPFGSVDATFEGEIAAKPDLGLELDFAPGTSIDDAETTISAEGLQVGSTYTLTMFSTPRVLYTGTVGASGGFTWVVALPADTPPGAHRLVLTGVAADGTPMSAQAWFTLGTGGRITAVSYTGPTAAGLAATGAEMGSGMLAAGILLLAGVAAVAASRRRRTV